MRTRRTRSWPWTTPSRRPTFNARWNWAPTLVVHSTTKYLGGHSDVVGGAVIVRDRGIHERLSFLQNAAGGVPGPMDCFLVLRGLKTLALRMERHGQNAEKLAEMLAAHPKVSRMLYPFHPSHPQHARCEATDAQWRRDDLVRPQRRTRGGRPMWRRPPSSLDWQNRWAAWNR